MASTIRVCMISFGLSAIIATNVNAGCEDILRYINNDTVRNYSSLTTEQVNNATFCSSDYKTASSSSRLQIEASYKLFSGGASGGQESIEVEQRSRCAGKFGQSYLQSIGVAQTSMVSPQAVAALEACYKSSSFQLLEIASSLNFFAATYRWSGNGSIRVAAVESSKLTSSSMDAADCRVSANGNPNVQLPVTVQSGRSVTVTCDRRSQARGLVGGDSFVEYPEGQVVLITSVNSVSIPLIRVADWASPIDRITDLERQVDVLANVDRDLQAQIASNGKSDSALATRIAGMRISVGPPSGSTDTHGGTPAYCGQNQVAVGFVDTERPWALDYFYCAPLSLTVPPN